MTFRLATAALERDAALGWNLIAPGALAGPHVDALCVALIGRRHWLEARRLPRLVESAIEYVKAAAPGRAAPGDDRAWHVCSRAWTTTPIGLLR